MGALIVNVLLKKLQFKNIAFFAMNIAPFTVFGITCLLYLLMILGHIDRNIFGTFSKYYILAILFSINYFIFGKCFLYNQKRKGGTDMQNTIVTVLNYFMVVFFIFFFAGIYQALKDNPLNKTGINI